MAPLRWLAVLFAVLLAATGAQAHFTEGTKLRTVVVAEGEGGLRAYLRVPAPLLFADDILTARETRAPMASPYLAGGAAEGYSLDSAAISAAPAAWRARLAGHIAWQQNGLPVETEVTGWRLVPAGEAPFRTLTEAEATLARPGSMQDPAFADGFVDIALTLHAPVPSAPLVLRSGAPELPLPAGVEVDNLLVDARAGSAAPMTVPGQMAEPVTLDGAWLTAMAEYGWQGIIHIVEGLDHVLLVVCIALGAGSVRRLVWLVTAFTAGHSVTLAAAAFGFVPSAPWFVPAIEAGIAATVLFAAGAAFLRLPGTAPALVLIGLLHGFGFSFVLGEVLDASAPGFVGALAAFNIGIELGQVAILLLTLGILRLAGEVAAKAPVALRAGALAGIATIAAFWTVERTAMLF